MNFSNIARFALHPFYFIFLGGGRGGHVPFSCPPSPPIGIGDRGRVGTCPPKIREKYFSANYYVNVRTTSKVNGKC